MAHLEGYSNKATVRKMLAHYERSFECEKENIDFTRTPRNKNYAPHREEGQENYLDSLLNEIPTIKSTTNILSDWIITLPKNEDIEKREDDFFQATYNWFVKTLPEGERSVNFSNYS